MAYERSITRLLMGVALSGPLAACSSSDDSQKKKEPVHTDAGSDAGARCAPDPSLAKRRDACEFATGAMAADTIGSCTGDAIPIQHVVILMQENRSFDQYFGHLPGNGQDDVDVAPAGTQNPAGGGGAAIPWHHESAYCLTDTDHGWSASHTQWNGGKNDGFATTNANAGDPTGARAMGYYDQTDIPFYYDLAKTFAISDTYFCSLLGPTYPNRLFFYGGTSYGAVTTDAKGLAPAAVPFLLRELDDKGVSWKGYKTNLPSEVLFTDYYAAHISQIVSADEFATDAAAGTLPSVSILDANYSDRAWLETDEHPPADMQLGEHWVYDQVTALMKSPLWPSSALFITYDEHGGLYDHVSPPAACAPDDIPPKQEANIAGFDRLGFRVPLIVVSPYAKRHFVSHAVHSHTSILRFLQAKFDLPALTKRDANSDAMLDLFDFVSPPKTDVPTFTEPVVDQAQIDLCKKNFPLAPPPDAGL
jgi:phospholipase C